LLNAMTGFDPDDPVTSGNRNRVVKDYSQLNASALKAKRIGIEKSFLQGHESVVALYRDAIKVLMKQGAEVIELEFLKPFSDLGDAEFLVLKYELKDGLNKYLSTANTIVKSLNDVIDFNRKNEEKTMPYFKQEIFEDSQSKGTLQEKEYIEALSKSTSARKMIDETLKSNALDAICAVTIGPANCIDPVNGDYSTGFYFAPPAAMAGYPHITVPMGKIHELPVGLSFISGAWKDFEVLNIAYAYEQATKKRMPPQFLTTIKI
jgi:amidase